MRRRMLTVAVFCGLVVLGVSCQQRSPVAPGPVGTLEDFVQALQRQGRSVTLAGELPRESNPFFSVPAHVVLVDQSHLNVFEYPNAEAAASDAARVPPMNMLITWISTPRFYRQGRLIALYAGCSTETIQALNATIGTSFFIGDTPCHRVN